MIADTAAASKNSRMSASSGTRRASLQGEPVGSSAPVQFAFSGEGTWRFHRLDPGQERPGFFSLRTRLAVANESRSGQGNDLRSTTYGQGPLAMSAARYLESLNPEQRRAVEHGVAGAAQHRRPAAGHRRRRIGQDQHARAPGRAPDRARRRSRAASCCSTFSRRAAAEMERRAERIVAAALGEPARRRAQPHQLVGHLPRRRRAAAAHARASRSGSIRPSPSTTARTSADLLNLVRHELGLSEKAQAVSAEGDVPRHLLARRQRRGAAGRVLAQAVSLVRRVGGRAARAVRGLRRGQAEAARARLRRSAALLGRADAGARAGGRGRRAVRPRAGRRVPGHQRAAGRDPAAASSPTARADRGRRRRAGDLRLSRRQRAQHPRFPEAVPAAGRDRHARAELPLDAADPGRVQRRHRPGARALHQEPALASGAGEQAGAGHGPRRHRPGRLRRRADPGEPRGAACRSRSRRCCSAPRTTAPCSRSS